MLRVLNSILKWLHAISCSIYKNVSREVLNLLYVMWYNIEIQGYIILVT